jgi:hypothetical protein
MRYNHHLQNHFKSCRLLKRGRDPHRERDVEYRLLPGEFEVVGIFDGVDSFVAQVSKEFMPDIFRIMEQIREGQDPPAIIDEIKSRGRVTLSNTAEVHPQVKHRVRVGVESEPQPQRRRVHVD